MLVVKPISPDLANIQIRITRQDPNPPIILIIEYICIVGLIVGVVVFCCSVFILLILVRVFW